MQAWGARLPAARVAPCQVPPLPTHLQVLPAKHSLPGHCLCFVLVAPD